MRLQEVTLAMSSFCARLDSKFSAESWTTFSDFLFFFPASLFD